MCPLEKECPVLPRAEFANSWIENPCNWPDGLPCCPLLKQEQLLGQNEIWKLGWDVEPLHSNAFFTSGKSSHFHPQWIWPLCSSWSDLSTLNPAGLYILEINPVLLKEIVSFPPRRLLTMLTHSPQGVRRTLFVAHHVTRLKSQQVPKLRYKVVLIPPLGEI